MPFSTVAVPFATYRDLPTAQHRWLLICLSRYADRDGKCWPSIRQLAADSKMSKSSVQRYLADLSHLGAFTRSRRAGGRYQYAISAPFRPAFRDNIDGRKPVPANGRTVPIAGAHISNIKKHQEIPCDSDRWTPRLRAWTKSGFWLPQWGEIPGKPGCMVPATVLREAGCFT